MPMDRAAQLARLAREDAVGQLRRRTGAMLHLGSEHGVPMLDWVDAAPRLLADPSQLEAVEQEAHALLARGVRHVIWAGMGGSVLAVQVLRAFGFCDASVRVYPLDSTDPQALNHLLRQLAGVKGVALPASQHERAAAPPDEAALCRTLLSDAVMVGVAMGKTSEEPISHLDWFGGLLRRGGLHAEEHLLAMSIPDSYLDRYARAQGIPRLPLQLDGGAGTPGRMSAPTTRVFLLPVALDLAARGAAPGALRQVLARAWAAYDLDGAEARPERHPFVRLAAALASAATDGACALAFTPPPQAPELDALRWWSEQLMEESLGKGGKGIVVFASQSFPTTPAASGGLNNHPLSGLRLHLTAEAPPTASNGFEIADSAELASGARDTQTLGDVTLYQPLLHSARPDERLAGVAATFLGLQLCAALYGYLNDIPFAGQPAVEAYKARARVLRAVADPIQTAEMATTALMGDGFRLLPPPSASPTPPVAPLDALAAALTPAPTYLDLSINGELAEADGASLEEQLRQLGAALGVPVKLRRAPACYHSTEQSEMDGPAGLVSLRALARQSAPTLLGAYDATFLRAQAVGTWFAMNEQGRACHLLVYDGAGAELGPVLRQLLAALAQRFSPSPGA